MNSLDAPSERQKISNKNDQDELIKKQEKDFFL